MEFPWARASQTSVRDAVIMRASLKAEVDWCHYWCFSSWVHNPYGGCERPKGSNEVLKKKKNYVNGKAKVMLKKRGALRSLKMHTVLQLKGFSFLKYLILKCCSQIQPSRGYRETDQPKNWSGFQKVIAREIAAYSIPLSLPALLLLQFFAV